jgi:hypothetical protein
MVESDPALLISYAVLFLASCPLVPYLLISFAFLLKIFVNVFNPKSTLSQRGIFLPRNSSYGVKSSGEAGNTCVSSNSKVFNVGKTY